jgi:hypothetical protein
MPAQWEGNSVRKGIVMEFEGDQAVVMTPEGEFVRISRPNKSLRIGEEIRFPPESRREAARFGRRLSAHGRRIAYAAASVLLVLAACLAALLGSYTRVAAATVAYVTLDFNPSVELGIDRHERVVTAEGLNEEGQLLLSHAEVTGVTLAEAALRLVRQAIALQLLPVDGEGEGAILVTSTVIRERIRLTEDMLNEKVVQSLRGELLAEDGAVPLSGESQSASTQPESSPSGHSPSGGSQAGSSHAGASQTGASQTGTRSAQPGAASGGAQPGASGTPGSGTPGSGGAQQPSSQQGAAVSASGHNSPAPVAGGLKGIKIGALAVPKELREEAKAQGVSPGKMAIRLLAEDRGTDWADDDEWKRSSISEIARSIGGIDKLMEENREDTKEKLQQLARQKQEQASAQANGNGRKGGQESPSGKAGGSDNDRGSDRGSDRNGNPGKSGGKSNGKPGDDRGNDRSGPGGVNRGNERGSAGGGNAGVIRNNDRGEDRGNGRGENRRDVREDDRGSDRGNDRSNRDGAGKGQDRGNDRGNDRGSDHGMDRGSGKDRGPDRDLIRDHERGKGRENDWKR